MKKWMLMSLMALGCCLGFTACGDDSEDDVVVNKATITETENQLVFKCTIKATAGNKSESCKLTWTCDFQDDRCTHSTYAWTFNKESYAKQAYEEMKAEGDTDVTISGKTVTQDVTRYFEGKEKDYIRHAMEEFKEHGFQAFF